jgi:hypothetical protein
MNIWINKATADLALVHPQYEPINIKFDEKFYHELGEEVKLMVGGRKIVHGVLVQVGWMLQNRNDVWFGLPLSIADQFEDLGEL